MSRKATASIRRPMTEDEVLGSSALANAFRVLKKHGLWRQVPLSLALVLAGFIEGLGITTLLPILRVIDNPNPGKLGQPELIIFSVLDFLHLPHTLGAMVLIFSLCMMVRAAISQQTSRFVGRIVAEIASELRNEVLDRLLQARWSYFTVNPVGRFVSAVSIEAVWGAYVYRTSLTVLAALIRAVTSQKIPCTPIGLPSASSRAVFMTWTWSGSPCGVTCSSTMSRIRPLSITRRSSARYFAARSSGKKS